MANSSPTYKFTIGEQNSGEPCFLVEEGKELIITLKAPADYEHAQRVKKFLEENIKGIEFDPDSFPAMGKRG